MDRTVRILIVEDSEDDALLLLRKLEQGGCKVVWERVYTRKAMTRALDNGEWDAVISDYRMPQFSAQDALELVKERGLDIPFIVVSGTIGEEKAVEIMKAGAHDYVMKDNLVRLCAALEREMCETANRAEQRRTTDELRETNDRLALALAEIKVKEKRIVRHERARAVGAMASGIAHDFNNSLAPILGFTELLLKRPGDLTDWDKVKRYLQLIHMAAEDAAGVVRRLRELYRPRSDEGKHASVNLKTLVEDVIELTKPNWKAEAQARDACITVEADFCGDSTAWGNEGELREVVTNLVLNSLDAMPDGGTISVATRRDSDRLCLEVSDTGSGMSEQTLNHCQEPFFTTKEKTGTGLGLAMIAEIVEGCGGTLSIQSTPDLGTTIEISLPVSDPGTTEQREETAAAVPVPKGLHVLIADDDPAVRQVLSEYLDLGGHTFETAENGRQAVDKFMAGDFDLVVADKAMPHISGNGVAERITEASPETPIVLLTGFIDGTVADSGGPAGTIVVEKPVTIGTFERALADVVAWGAAGILSSRPSSRGIPPSR
ncbi:response regulator [Planctomycetota bacterium]